MTLVVMASEKEKTTHDNHIEKGLIIADCPQCNAFFTKAVVRGRLKEAD